MWNQLPAKYGKWNSVWRTFRRWCESGMWEWLLQRLSAQCQWNDIGVMLDATHIKVHQDATRHPLSPQQQRLGKTKGGRNTKLSLLVNLAGLPLSMKLVCGNEHDSKSAIDTLRGFVKGNFVLADRAYDTNAIRQYIEACGGFAVIPNMPQRIKPFDYDKQIAKLRHKVENTFAKLKRFRRIATRYDKLPQTFMGFLTLAAITLWHNFHFVHVA
jgi:transposase